MSFPRRLEVPHGRLPGRSFDKWLKDHRGRKLSFDDLMHYQKVIVASKETIWLMEEIDRAILGRPIE